MKQQRCIRGFSLLEMMIVLLIIGIGAAAIRVAVVAPDPLKPLEDNAYEFSGWLGSYMDQALLKNEAYGLYFTETAVGLMKSREGDPAVNEPEGPIWYFSEESGDQFEFNDDRDTIIELALNLEASEWISLENQLTKQEDLDGFLEPHIILLPSEEYSSSFKLIFRQRSDTEQQVSILGDGYNRVEVSREDQ